MKKFKQKKNLLREFIFKDEMKQSSEQTVKSLLRSVVEPVIESNSDGVVLVRLFDTKGLDGLLKRLEFSKAGIYFYSDMGQNIINIAEEDIWDTVEFAVVLAPRYCAALIWDYNSSDVEGYTNINLYINSRKVQDVLKIIIDNSRIDFMPDVEPYSLERRDNDLMCSALHKVVDYLNEMVLENHITTQTVENKQEASKPELSAEVRKIIHEVRNNLSVINLHSKIIEKRAEKITPESVEKILNAKSVIEKASNSVNMLLDDLKSSTSVNLDNMSIEDIAETALELSAPKFEKKNITVETDLNKIDVLVDETKVLGVLLNVINNAIYALDENGKLKVSVKANGDDTVSLFVENNGEAISKENQSKIFETGFTTKKQTELAGGGSGLGLEISRTSMRLMGGDLSLLKSDEVSTVFELKMKKGGL